MEQQPVQPTLPELPQTPNTPGAVTDTRDGITVESNTGTAEELKTSLDALDAAIEKAEPEREEKTGRFTSKQRRSNPVARMEEATAREAAAKRERDEVKAEHAKLAATLERMRQIPPPQPPDPNRFQQRAEPEAPPPPTDPEPDAADLAKYPAGRFDAQYLRDIGRWEARQEYQRQRAEDQRVQAHERQLVSVEKDLQAYAKRMQDSFSNGGMEKFLQSMPPQLLNLRPTAVHALFSPGQPITAANAIADCISDAEKPVELMTYLRDNAQTFQRLLTLHPRNVLREMGRIEASLATAPSARTAPEKEPVSRARPPVQRVESVPQISDAAPGDDASDQEHADYYNRKERARRYGR